MNAMTHMTDAIAQASPVQASPVQTSPVQASPLHARFDGSYRGDFWTALPHSAIAVNLPGFAMLNARLGMGFSRTWRAEAFINNITNRIGATAVSPEPGLDHERADYVSRPRTIGLELHYSFKGK